MCYRADFDIIDSTNEEAKRIFKRYRTAPVLVVSKCQTRGKGRNNRYWRSPPDKGLYLTYGNLSNDVNNIAFRLMLLSSLAVTDTLKKFIPTENIEIKWPNDILINGKKVCGILNEGLNIKEGIFFIIGIGLNIREHDDPDEDFRFSYNYLERYSKHALNACELSQSLTEKLLIYDKRIKSGAEIKEMLKTYRELLYRPPNVVRVARMHNKETIAGIIKGIDESGNLQVECNDSLISLSSAEILESTPLFG